jgi:hypothetical protein
LSGSEINKIEAEQELAGSDASLAGTRNGKGKFASDTNIVSPVVECERTDEEKMANHNSDNSSTAQSVKLKITTHGMFN